MKSFQVAMLFLVAAASTSYATAQSLAAGPDSADITDELAVIIGAIVSPCFFSLAMGSMGAPGPELERWLLWVLRV